jgi:hypothetical protein
MIAALYVAKGGVYFDPELTDVDPWDEDRDARLYHGPWPVVAHPPCQRWGALARVNFKRWGGEHNRPGNDGGCFRHARACVRQFGGVLEHPAFSYAWDRYELPRPVGVGWTCRYPQFNSCSPHTNGFPEWVCEVWQSAYGHRARKRTWLYYVGPKPPELDWLRMPGSHQVGWFDRAKPTLSKREANATPLPFRDMLLDLARSVAR